MQNPAEVHPGLADPPLSLELNVEPLPPVLWLILGALLILALVGAGFWISWVTGVPAEQLAGPTWRFLCH